jgi:hypothetical protein
LSPEPGVSSEQTKAALKKLADAIDGISAVIGLSAVLMKALGQSIDGLRAFPNFDLAKIDLPVTQSDAQHHAFKHQKGHDLTGFEDGE